MSELHVLTTYPEVYSEKRMTDVFPETRLEFSSGSATAPVDFAIEDGKSYIIYFDYVDYEIVAASGAIANDLFSISVSDGVLTVSAADGYHTVGVTACETVYSKLPSSYVEGGGGQGGGETSWNDLKDKPFGTEMGTASITWDGDTTGLESVSMAPLTFCKVSDIVLTADQLIGNAMTFLEAGESVSVELTESNVTSTSSAVFCKMDGINLIISTNGFSSEGMTFTVGTWFAKIPAYEAWTSSATYSAEVIKPLDPKYIILTSPNGTKYNLSVSDSGTLSATEAD